ncbi:MAG: hypothetical protein IK102_07250 [Treponema sp.]|nr:hypothetical protein [Treponema sp.]
MKKSAIFIVCIFIISTLFFAQEALKSTEEEYYDFLSLTGVVARPTLGYRTLSDSVWELDEDEEHVWSGNNLGTTFILWQPDSQSDNWFTRGIFQGLKARIYGPEWFNSYNTAAPYGQNDGALWQGVGYNTSLTTGLRLEGYGFELTFKPQLSWMQNKAFETNPDIYPSPYSYTFKSGTVYQPIDLVQRYGDKSLWNYDWGDSEIRWTWHALTFGFGNQSPWLGPAILNPMLGSNNAATYTKFDAGLRKLNVTIPYLNWDLGNIEGRIWVGKLKNSDYFDQFATRNQDRMLTAMSANYEPSFIPGLTIGLNRIFLTYWRTENLKYILRLFTASHSNALSSSGNDEDQKCSLFASWEFPQAGFRVFGEYGFDDFTSSEYANPFHTGIYTVGFKQDIPLPNNLKSELSFELNNFEMSQDFQLQWSYLGFYSHGFVNQGLTNKGQIIGAGTGAFGNSQFLQYKIIYEKGYTSIKLHRFCPNNNSIYSQAVSTSAGNSDFYLKWYANFETYLSAGCESNYFITKDFSVIGSITYIFLVNPVYKHFEWKHCCNTTLLLKYNL